MKTPREVAHDGMMYSCPALGHFHECDRMTAAIAARDASLRAEADEAWRALRLLLDNHAAFEIARVPAATVEAEGYAEEAWDMCPHCGGDALTCDKTGECWGARVRKLAALALRPRGTP